MLSEIFQVGVAFAQIKRYDAASASVSISIVSPPSPPGSWSRTAPFGGIISNLTVDPRARNIVYLAAFNAGVFKSSDSGQTWTQVIAPAQSSFNTNQISSIAVGSVSSTLYFVNGLLPNPLILYTSVDGGATISKQNLPANLPGTNLAVDPQNDHVLYISGPNGISKSTDAGSTWNNLSTAPTDVNVVRVDPGNSQVIYAGALLGLFKSTDGGTTWNAVSSGINSSTLDISDIAIDATNTAKVSVGVNSAINHDGHIYMSTNGGTSWSETTAGGNGWLFAQVGQIQLNANTLYAAVSTSGNPAVAPVLKSTDGGVHWSPAATGLPPSPGGSIGLLLLLSSSPDNLLFGTRAPVSLLRSTDGASSWSPSATGISGFSGVRIILDPTTSTLYFVASNGGGLWKSTDLGSTWTNLLGLSVSALAVDPGNSLHLLVARADLTTMLQSTDGGTTFSPVSFPLTGLVNDLEISPTQSGLALACVRGNGIARSTDGGSTWNASNTGLQDTDCLQVAFDPLKPNIVFATTQGGIFGSSDGGQNWTLKETVAGESALKFDPTDSNVIYASGITAFIKSTDGGNTWNVLEVPNVLSFPAAISIDPLAHNTVYAAAFGSGRDVAVSTDAGHTWATVDSGLGFALVNDIVVIPGTMKLFAATFNNGVLEFK